MPTLLHGNSGVGNHRQYSLRLPTGDGQTDTWLCVTWLNKMTG